jgi:hypothetical protein
LLQIELAAAQESLRETHVGIAARRKDDASFIEVDRVVAADGVEREDRGLVAADDGAEEIRDCRLRERSLNGEFFGHWTLKVYPERGWARGAGAKDLRWRG